jgi:hypothetical protein
MGFILSCATTPSRIQYLLQILPMIRGRYKYFVINICQEYKRFGRFKLPKELISMCKQHKRIIFNFVYDFGPVCKYIGGFEFMKRKGLKDDKLIIIDDDTLYNKDLFYDLMEEKTENNITTGSGFNYGEQRNYIIVEGETEMVEGYAGICFDYNQLDKFIFWYVAFYKCIHWDSDQLLDKYLKASFLGDDFIISNCYDNKLAIKDGRKNITPQGFGFLNDALHKNNHFGSNMGSYLFLYENIKILETFKLKYKLNKEINESSFLQFK